MTPGLAVLIVEDDEAIAAGLALNFKIEGYVPAIAGDGEQALAHIRAAEPALVVLDITLPVKSGLEVLAELRAAGYATPVIVLSARQDEFDKVAALRLGADDYVTKPFALAELLARCTAVLRRAQPMRSTGEDEARQASFGRVRVDFSTLEVRVGGTQVALTHLEFELLSYFLAHPAKVLAREHLLGKVWRFAAGSPRTVDNFVAQLRAKLERDPEHPRHFITVRGSGYRFDP